MDQPPVDHQQEPPIRRELEPIGVRERILTLDALRGFALLGIFMVNMPFFAMPFMDGFVPPDQNQTTKADLAAWNFVTIFCEYKFISLFSMMFGMGLVVQMNRAAAAGRPFVPVYLRRLAVLAALGLMHGLFLWYGDILFLYSMVGAILLLCRQLPAKPMLMIAGVLLAAMLLVQTSLVGLGMLAGGSQWMQGSSAPASLLTQGNSINNGAIELDETAFFVDAPVPALVNETIDEPSSALARVFQQIRNNPNSSSDEWRRAEVQAYREGPFIDAFAFRAFSYCIAIGAAILGYGWRVLAMFMLGAALMKLNFFHPSRKAWHTWIAVLGIGLGLPMEAAANFLAMQSENEIGWIQLPKLWMHEIGSLCLCLGYAGTVTLIAQSGRIAWLVKAVACVGRMSLTNYLSQTIITTSIMYWWGLGMFNEVSRFEQVVLVLVIYSAQLIASVLWLKVFSIGPVEWLWRSVTYGRFQPMLQRRQSVIA